MVLAVFFVVPAGQKIALAAGSLLSTILSETVNSGIVHGIRKSSSAVSAVNIHAKNFLNA